MSAPRDVLNATEALIGALYCDAGFEKARAFVLKPVEEEIGVPYPWDKYDQVTIQDFVAGGMENTSLTTLTDHTLHAKATGTLRSSRSLDAHEMAHQWFGDLVTMGWWDNLWLNEGFATWMESKATERFHPRWQTWLNN